MKRVAFFLLLFNILIVSSIETRTINIPANYSTIQAGINASVNGDTVLVQPGTYHERINYNGHNIKLGSLYLTDGDTAHIANTIIDGDSAGTVVTFNHDEDNTAAIMGFTIRNGSGGQDSGGGIQCNESNPEILHNIIRQNHTDVEGGGIRVTGGSASIIENRIENNAVGVGGLYCAGGGISCRNSIVLIANNRITNNRAGTIGASNDGWGGGIVCNNSTGIIIRNIIASNHANMWGGGIILDDSNYTVSDNTIFENSCGSGLESSGGGIVCGSNTKLIGNCIFRNSADRYGGGVRAQFGTRILNNTIINNNATSWAGGIYIEEASYIINTIIRSNLASQNPNIMAEGGIPEIKYSNIEGGWSGVGNINRDPMFRNPANNDYRLKAIACGYSSDSPCIDAGSPSILDSLLDCSHGLGNDRSDMGAFGGHFEITNGSPRIILIPLDYPTIQDGISSCVEGDTILVMPGIYYENLVTYSNNITLASLFLTTNNPEYIESTIIDGNHSGSVISIQPGLDSTTIICGFIIQNGLADTYGGGIYCRESNPVICNNIIKNNRAYHEYGGVGGGIFCQYSRAIIKDNFIIHNSSNDVGGGIAVFDPGGKIINNMIIGNNAEGDGGGGLFLTYATSILIDNTISDNIAANIGGGILSRYENHLIIRNSIIWNNTAGVDPSMSIDSTSSAIISYCDIEGNWPGVGNINSDPQFRDPTQNDYLLKSIICGDNTDSPCIDMGDPYIIDSLLICDKGLGTERSDIGAYGMGYASIIGVDDDASGIPLIITISQNYPNPFNPTTTIQYDLPKPSKVSVEIFDILGRKIETIVNAMQEAGHHTAAWDGSERSSGIYFYRLQAGDYSETRKMLLVK